MFYNLKQWEEPNRIRLLRILSNLRGSQGKGGCIQRIFTFIIRRILDENATNAIVLLCTILTYSRVNCWCLLFEAVCGGEHVPGGDERTSTVELAAVRQVHDPREFVFLCLFSAHNPRLAPVLATHWDTYLTLRLLRLITLFNYTGVSRKIIAINIF